MKVLLTVAVTLVVSLAGAGGAQAAEIWASVSDPRGDAYSAISGHGEFDLARFELRYDDSAGTFTTAFDVHSWPDYLWGYVMLVKVGVWQPSTRTCDVNSTGGARLKLYPAIDAPHGAAYYSVVNYAGGYETYAPMDNVEHGMRLSDAGAFARRGYNCFVDVVLDNHPGGDDPAPGVFCMGPSGTVTCRTSPTPISIRWTAPRDGQTVSGVLTEGRSSCWAESTGPIVRTENWVDGRLHDRQINYPWGCEWDTRQYANGPHTLTVKAFAADGRTVENTVRVNVSNASPSIPPNPPPVIDEQVPPRPTSQTGPTPAVPAPQTPAAGGQPTAPTAPVARALSYTRAKRLVRRQLTKQFGKRFTRRADRGYSLSCSRLTIARATCRVAWRYRGARYSGSIGVTLMPKGSRVTPRITIRRP